MASNSLTGAHSAEILAALVHRRDDGLGSPCAEPSVSHMVPHRHASVLSSYDTGNACPLFLCTQSPPAYKQSVSTPRPLIPPSNTMLSFAYFHEHSCLTDLTAHPSPIQYLLQQDRRNPNRHTHNPHPHGQANPPHSRTLRTLWRSPTARPTRSPS